MVEDDHHRSTFHTHEIHKIYDVTAPVLEVGEKL